MPEWICPCCGTEYHGWAGYYMPSPCCGAALVKPGDAQIAAHLQDKRENP